MPRLPNESRLRNFRYEKLITTVTATVWPEDTLMGAIAAPVKLKPAVTPPPVVAGAQLAVPLGHVFTNVCTRVICPVPAVAVPESCRTLNPFAPVGAVTDSPLKRPEPLSGLAFS